MNRALGYLWFSLLRRQAWQFLRNFRRPTTAIGFVALMALACLLYHYRHEDVFAQLVRRESLWGGALLMLAGSLFKGFLQRGLVFQPPDLEFLFTSPFSQRQIICYRLLPHYLFAVLQGAGFLILFSTHIAHPLLAAAGLILFQIACFHLAAGAAIYAGTVSDSAHHRIRWMLLGIYLVLTALYLRLAWDLKFVPDFLVSPLAQVAFYPAVTIQEVGAAPIILAWARQLVDLAALGQLPDWQPLFYLTLFAASAAATLWVLLRIQANIYESSMAVSNSVAERRLLLRQGRSLTVAGAAQARSARLPNARLFGGVRAVIWKNLVVAGRCRRELLVAAVFTTIYTGFLIALRWSLHHYVQQGADLPASTVMDFDNGLAAMLCFLPFLLQRAFAFDFRRDGEHLAGFRTLPVSPVGLVLAELAVPTLLSLAYQGIGVSAMMLISGFAWRFLLLMVFGFPAVALALNIVWNLHYFLAAARRASRPTESDSPVTLLMVVALSLLVFYPAGWAALKIGRTFDENFAIAAWLLIQYQWISCSCCCWRNCLGAFSYQAMQHRATPSVSVTTQELVPTSLWDKLTAVFACPGIVFDEVVTAPPTLVNWRLPTLLVCLAGILSLQFTQAGASIDGIPALAHANSMDSVRQHNLAGIRPLVSALAVCVATVVGSLWSALVLWLIGRVFLRVRFPLVKAMEIVGLSGMVLVLGTIVTTLLISSGSPDTRPSLAFLAAKLILNHPIRQALETINVFHLWSSTLLSLGLARLCAVAFREAAFWVFGYWLLAKLVLILLR